MIASMPATKNQKLFKYIAGQEWEEAKSIVRKYKRLAEQKDEQGYTIFDHACMQRKVDILSSLKRDLKLKGHPSTVVMEQLIYDGEYHYLVKLIRDGYFPINSVDDEGYTLLDLALYARLNETDQVVIEKLTELIKQLRRLSGYSVIEEMFDAAKKRRWQQVFNLLGKDIDANQPDFADPTKTLLFYAQAQMNAQVCSRLQKDYQAKCIDRKTFPQHDLTCLFQQTSLQLEHIPTLGPQMYLDPRADPIIITKRNPQLPLPPPVGTGRSLAKKAEEVEEAKEIEMDPQDASDEHIVRLFQGLGLS